MLRHKVTLFSLLGLLLLSTVADAKIAFSSLRDGVYSIHVMDDDGSNQTLITESEDLRPVLPQWSPDGKQILFQRSVRINAKTVFFLMNVDGRQSAAVARSGLWGQMVITHVHLYQTPVQENSLRIDTDRDGHQTVNRYSFNKKNINTCQYRMRGTFLSLKHFGISFVIVTERTSNTSKYRRTGMGMVVLTGWMTVNQSFSVRV